MIHWPTAPSEACMTPMGLTAAGLDRVSYNLQPQKLLAECRRYATPPLLSFVIILGDLREPRH